MKLSLLIFASALVLGSCIKDAPPNPEADIETFEVDPTQLTGKTFIDQGNGRILLYLSKEAYASGIAPKLTVSKNATVKPSSGEKITFGNSGEVIYTVTAEQTKNVKTYKVQVINVGDWNFEFEKWQQNNDDKYEFPVQDDGSVIWSSGNQGVALSGVPSERLSYPTRSTADGFMSTKGAEMVTIKGTALSAFVGIYLYAGSLFIGNFDPSNVLISPLSATKFGEPYVGLPGRFTGQYKYTPGSVFQDENQNPIPGKTDECSIYAVLFEGTEPLDGTNINTSDRIVATAKLTDGSAKANFTSFDIPFTYKSGWTQSPGKTVMLTIVASSSKEGDQYRGALGSRLVVDNLAITPR